ncbi:hypothetical protein L9F63_019423, partial [Diploptera punctata]
ARRRRRQQNTNLQVPSNDFKEDSDTIPEVSSVAPSEAGPSKTRRRRRSRGGNRRKCRAIGADTESGSEHKTTSQDDKETSQTDSALSDFGEKNISVVQETSQISPEVVTNEIKLDFLSNVTKQKKLSQCKIETESKMQSEVRTDSKITDRDFETKVSRRRRMLEVKYRKSESVKEIKPEVRSEMSKEIAAENVGKTIDQKKEISAGELCEKFKMTTEIETTKMEVKTRIEKNISTEEEKNIEVETKGHSNESINEVKTEISIKSENENGFEGVENKTETGNGIKPEFDSNYDIEMKSESNEEEIENIVLIPESVAEINNEKSRHEVFNEKVEYDILASGFQSENGIEIQHSIIDNKIMDVGVENPIKERDSTIVAHENDIENKSKYESEINVPNNDENIEIKEEVNRFQDISTVNMNLSCEEISDSTCVENSKKPLEEVVGGILEVDNGNKILSEDIPNEITQENGHTENDTVIFASENVSMKNISTKVMDQMDENNNRFVDLEVQRSDDDDSNKCFKQEVEEEIVNQVCISKEEHTMTEGQENITVNQVIHVENMAECGNKTGMANSDIEKNKDNINKEMSEKSVTCNVSEVYRKGQQIVECKAIVLEAGIDELWEEVEELGESEIFYDAKDGLSEDMEKEDKELLDPSPVMEAEEEETLRSFIHSLNLADYSKEAVKARNAAMQNATGKSVEDMYATRKDKRKNAEAGPPFYSHQRGLEVILEENSSDYSDVKMRNKAWEEAVYIPETDEVIYLTRDSDSGDQESTGSEQESNRNSAVFYSETIVTSDTQGVVEDMENVLENARECEEVESEDSRRDEGEDGDVRIELADTSDDEEPMECSWRKGKARERLDGVEIVYLDEDSGSTSSGMKVEEDGGEDADGEEGPDEGSGGSCDSIYENVEFVNQKMTFLESKEYGNKNKDIHECSNTSSIQEDKSNSSVLPDNYTESDGRYSKSRGEIILSNTGLNEENGAIKEPRNYKTITDSNSIQLEPDVVELNEHKPTLQNKSDFLNVKHIPTVSSQSTDRTSATTKNSLKSVSSSEENRYENNKISYIQNDKIKIETNSVEQTSEVITIKISPEENSVVQKNLSDSILSVEDIENDVKEWEQSNNYTSESNVIQKPKEDQKNTLEVNDSDSDYRTPNITPEPKIFEDLESITPTNRSRHGSSSSDAGSHGTAFYCPSGFSPVSSDADISSFAEDIENKTLKRRKSPLHLRKTMPRSQPKSLKEISREKVFSMPYGSDILRILGISIAKKPPQSLAGSQWLGMPTKEDPNIFICLSPSQKESYHQGEDPTPEEAENLLDLHRKFIHRRGYHEEVPPPPPSRKFFGIRHCYNSNQDPNFEYGLYPPKKENVKQNVASANIIKSPRFNAVLTSLDTKIHCEENTGEILSGCEEKRDDDTVEKGASTPTGEGNSFSRSRSSSRLLAILRAASSDPGNNVEFQPPSSSSSSAANSPPPLPPLPHSYQNQLDMLNFIHQQGKRPSTICCTTYDDSDYVLQNGSQQSPSAYSNKSDDKNQNTNLHSPSLKQKNDGSAGNTTQSWSNKNGEKGRIQSWYGQETDVKIDKERLRVKSLSDWLHLVRCASSNKDDDGTRSTDSTPPRSACLSTQSSPGPVRRAKDLSPNPEARNNNNNTGKEQNGLKEYQKLKQQIIERRFSLPEKKMEETYQSHVEIIKRPTSQREEVRYEQQLKLLHQRQQQRLRSQQLALKAQQLQDKRPPLPQAPKLIQPSAPSSEKTKGRKEINNSQQYEEEIFQEVLSSLQEENKSEKYQSQMIKDIIKDLRKETKNQDLKNSEEENKNRQFENENWLQNERKFDAEVYKISKKGDIAIINSNSTTRATTSKKVINEENVSKEIESFHRSKSSSRPKSMPGTTESLVTGCEFFRQQMYNEYMNKVAERAERRRQKVIRLTSGPRDDAVGKQSDATESAASALQLENEFMGKVRARMDKLGLKYDEESDDGGIEKGVEGGGEGAELPKHLQEFLVITGGAGTDSEVNSDVDGEFIRRVLVLCLSFFLFRLFFT